MNAIARMIVDQFHGLSMDCTVSSCMVDRWTGYGV